MCLLDTNIAFYANFANMKKAIVLSAFVLLACFSAGAQMMPDSTVQVVAYWDKGDKVMYSVESSTKRIYKSGEEEVLLSSSENDYFEVVDQTDTSYILRLTMKDVVTSTVDDPLDAEFMSDMIGRVQLDYLTDECGDLKSFYNIYSESERVLEELPKWCDEFIKQKGHALKAKQKERLKALAGGLSSQFGDSDALYNNTVPTLTNMLFFHGLRLDTTRVYNVNTKIDAVFGHSFETEQSFWVDSAQSDTTFVVIRGHASLGNDTLMPYLEEAVMDGFRQSTADEDEYQESWDSWLQEAVDSHLQVTLDKYWLWVIHLPTGWPSQVGILTETKLVSDDEEINTVSDNQLVFKEFISENP